MKSLKVKLALGLGALCLAGSAVAQHDHGHGHGGGGGHYNNWGIGLGLGIGIGALIASPPGYYYSPGYYYPPSYYYPPTYYDPPVVVISQPVSQPPQTVYVQPASIATPEPDAQTNSWYYCHDAKAYYPYVKECPSGWQVIPAHPPAR